MPDLRLHYNPVNMGMLIMFLSGNILHFIALFVMVIMMLIGGVKPLLKMWVDLENDVG